MQIDNKIEDNKFILCRTISNSYNSMEHIVHIINSNTVTGIVSVISKVFKIVKFLEYREKMLVFSYNSLLDLHPLEAWEFTV